MQHKIIINLRSVRMNDSLPLSLLCSFFFSSASIPPFAGLEFFVPKGLSPTWRKKKDEEDPAEQTEEEDKKKLANYRNF